jgi:acyl dehydratase
MPLPSSFVGAKSASRISEIDSRWSMAYAAALGDLKPCYMDTRAPQNFIAHPIFPVCFEWPVVVEMAGQLHGTELKAEESRRAVHATHDLIIHRPIRPPEKLTTRAVVNAVERRKPGAFQVMRLETFDESGALVCTSSYGTIYRGVDVSGPDKPLATNIELPRAKRPASQGDAASKIHIDGGAAHIYTECARIHNPIHTDLKVARDAGLPGLILHGTATLALAVSRIIESHLDGDPIRVARVAGRFNAMVMMPSDIGIRALAREPFKDAELIHFEVLNQDGHPAISDGAIVTRR